VLQPGFYAVCVFLAVCGFLLGFYLPKRFGWLLLIAPALVIAVGVSIDLQLSAYDDQRGLGLALGAIVAIPVAAAECLGRLTRLAGAEAHLHSAASLTSG
jgi:hypothetical protein